jgi:protoheme IX farnesyltransferase
MLPVVAGERVTRNQIGLYTIPMVAVAIAPWPLGLTHAIYGVVATLASAFFALLAFRVATRRTQAEDRMRPEKRLFAYSIVYLFVIFGAFAADRLLA